ncbi:hypothetical protein MXB_5190 [Myxobolus squamalis]|nr:hypothetical protein MXB_5190 [Myxobolus squamalis]
MDDVIILALTMVLRLIENPQFLFKFMDTEGLSRICCIPHCLASSSCVILILAKISRIPTYMEYILKNRMDNFKITMKYCIYFFCCLDNKKSCNFITNTFDYPEFYEFFICQNGIKSIISNACLFVIIEDKKK